MAPEPFDPPDVPPGDTPPGGVGMLISGVRQRRGWSQQRLAERLCAVAQTPTVTRHEISRWERGERIPSGHWLGWLAAVLGLPVETLEVAAARSRSGRATARDQVGSAPTCGDPAGSAPAGSAPAGSAPTGGAPTTPGSRRATTAPTGRGVGRRAAGQPYRPAVVAGAVRAGPARSGHAGRQAGAGPTGAPAGIGALRRMDDLVGGVDLATQVLAALRAGTGWSPGLVRPPAPPAGGPAAELAQLASWVLADAGRHADAVAAGRFGLRAAQRSGDPWLTGHILGCLAEAAAEAGDAATALRLVRAACDRSGGAPAPVRVATLHRTAYVSACCGLRDAGELALATAERTRAPAGAGPPWLYWLDELHLTALAGRCYAALGRYRPARALLAEVLGSEQLGPRGRAVCGAWLGLAAVAAGDLDAARAAAGPALLAAVRSGSVRAATRVRVLDTALRRRLVGVAAQRYAELAVPATGYLPDAVDAAATAIPRRAPDPPRRTTPDPPRRAAPDPPRRTPEGGRPPPGARRAAATD